MVLGEVFMSRSILVKAAATLLTFASVTGSRAWAYGCTGTLDSVSLSPTGIVTVTSASSLLGTFYVCQVGTTENSVGPDACNAILASLIAAKEAGEQVQWQFDDQGTGGNCTTHAQWTWLTGWYYGPVLQ